MRFVPSILIALAIVLAPVVWHVSQPFLTPPEVTESDPRLVAEIGELREELDNLRDQVDALDSRTARGLISEDRQFNERSEPNPDASDALRDAFAQVVLIANRREANAGLTIASTKFRLELLGMPREDLTDDCQPATNPKLQGLLKLENVGPIRAHLVEPALISIRQVFANVQVFEPELYARIKSAGSLCVRRIRGSTSSISAHAHGLAVDINIDGVLDTLGDGKTQLGLTLLADFFKKEGWIWGAAFGREDSMHFEVSREKLEQWRRLGQI